MSDACSDSSRRPSLPGVVLPSTVILLVWVVGYYTHCTPLETSRPRGEKYEIPPPPSPAGIHAVHSRLWEDPLAITVERFEELVLPKVTGGHCPHPKAYILSDTAERDDTVGPYGRSLLYLVSNAFEGSRGTPLLGMERFVHSRPNGDNSDVNPNMDALFQQKVAGLPSLVVAGVAGPDSSVSQSRSHGGFDNDPATLNSVLWRILGGTPKRLFTVRDLQY